MSVETYDVTSDALRVSDEAARHLKQQLDSHGARGVRISVKESGCTGYMYVMDEVDQSADGDLIINLDNGLELYVDPDSLHVLRGTEIAYEQEGINRSIRFHNPNVTGACGCGESFSVN